MNTRPVSFPNWKEALASAALSPQLKTAYAREILTFLRHCKASHAPATVELARQYLDWREKQSTGPAREALRWFYQQGRRPGPALTPAPALPRKFRQPEPPPVPGKV